MKQLKMTVGLPRSGKSTVIDICRVDEVVLSADELRLQMYGQRFFFEGEQMMWAVHDIIFKMLLKQGTDIILDGTNITVERRKPVIQAAKAAGYTITALVLKTSAEECKRRAIETMRSDVLQVIDRQEKSYNEPTPEEGFDAIMKF